MRLSLPAIALLLGCAAAPPATPPPSAPPPIASATPRETSAPEAQTPPVPLPPAKKRGPCSVPDFLAMSCADDGGTYEVVGYVVAVDAPPCPPCPPRVNCTPCRPGFIVLSSKRHPSDLNVVAAGNLHVDVPVGARFTVGQEVKIRVETQGSSFVGDPCCTPGPYFVRLASP